MRSRRAPLALLAATVVTALLSPVGAAHAAPDPDPIEEAIAASSAPGHTWEPGPETYGVKKQGNVAVKMSDGVVLRAQIQTPTDPTTGEPAAGPFPVLLSLTPYGNQTAGALDSSALGADPYFVKRGYISVSVDVRGTGNSGGKFDLFDPKQTSDGVALVNWVAKLPHANGKVGMHGASYLGIQQLLVAGAVGKNSPLKAIFPSVSANDLYRDTAFMGGIPNIEFDVLYLGGIMPLVTLLGPISALLQNLTQPGAIESSLENLLGHARNNLDYNARFLVETYLGGPDSYDTDYWRRKAPQNVLANIVANDIPAYLIGGHFDIFQRGTPYNYAGLQNAWAGRATTAPMTSSQPVTGRYQALIGPYTHLKRAAIDGKALNPLQLKWFDTWLKSAKTGMDQTRTPLHYYDLGTGHYDALTSFPVEGARPTTMYFSGTRSGSAPSKNDGTLSPVAPKTSSGSDPVSWLPASTSICDRSVDQWSLGILSTITENFPRPTPCFDDDRPSQVGPSALTYTTEPMTNAQTLAGPISASIYASANTRDTQWVVTIQDVAPNGVSRPLTQGALLGSARAVDDSRSWVLDGKTLMPYHPYSQASSKPVVPGKVTRYDVEVFPTFSTIAKGHRLRVSVNTNDFPHLLPTAPQLLALTGGKYQVQRTSTAPSSITVPLRPQ